jgi:ABC-type transport system involved in cytochrome c biogenesis permease component
MSTLLTLLAKETKALFSALIAYAVIAVFLLLMGYSFPAFLFLNKTSTLVHLFFQAAVLFLLIVPVLTMRQFAEERKTGTLELLLTAPVREVHIVLAKFLASMAVNASMLTLTLTYAGVLQVYGKPDWGPIYSGYLGLVLFTAALVALGVTVSALTANQIVAEGALDRAHAGQPLLLGGERAHPGGNAGAGRRPGSLPPGQGPPGHPGAIHGAGGAGGAHRPAAAGGEAAPAHRRRHRSRGALGAPAGCGGGA